MLTQAMPALARALGGKLDPQTLSGLMNALGNCGQPLEHRGPVAINAGLPPTGKQGVYESMPWNPADYADIAPQLASPAAGWNFKVGGPNATFAGNSYGGYSAYSNSAQYGNSFPFFGQGGFGIFNPFIDNRQILQGDFGINITLPPYAPAPPLLPGPQLPPDQRPSPLPPGSPGTSRPQPAEERQQQQPPVVIGLPFPATQPGSQQPAERRRPGERLPPNNGGVNIGIGGAILAPTFDTKTFITFVSLKNRVVKTKYIDVYYQYKFNAESCDLEEILVEEEKEFETNIPTLQPTGEDSFRVPKL